MLGVDAVVSAASACAKNRLLGASSFASFAKGGLFFAAISPVGAIALREAATTTSSAALVARSSYKNFNISDASESIALQYIALKYNV